MENMKNKDELVGLFRSRLGDSQMDVRDGFWESLQKDLPDAATTVVPGKRKKMLWLYRVSVAASVLLLLGVGSVAIWHFSPKEEIQHAFTQVQNLGPQPVLPVEVPHASAEASVAEYESVREGDSDSSAMQHQPDNRIAVRLSFTMSEYHAHGSYNTGSQIVVSRNVKEDAQFFSDNFIEQAEALVVSNSDNAVAETEQGGKWALKISVGSALPKGDFLAPVMAGISVEHSLNKKVSLETGLQYHALSAKGNREVLNVLAIPAKMNVVLGQRDKWLCYASLGGALEKVLEKNFDEDPLRLSVSAGIGISYKINDRFSVFAEPMVSHHFHTDASIKSLRTERATNMNLLCGVRIQY